MEYIIIMVSLAVRHISVAARLMSSVECFSFHEYGNYPLDHCYV